MNLYVENTREEVKKRVVIFVIKAGEFFYLFTLYMCMHNFYLSLLFRRIRLARTHTHTRA